MKLWLTSCDTLKFYVTNLLMIEKLYYFIISLKGEIKKITVGVENNCVFIGKVMKPTFAH